MPAIEMTNPAALPADWRDILALTKPRVMSLVVFTGLCGLLAAPAAAAAGARLHRDPVHRARRRRVRRAQPMVRGRPRREDAAHRQAAAARGPDGPADGAPFRRRPRRLLGAADGPCDQLAGGGAARRFDPVLRAGLHRLAEAADGAEHRHRRRRRRVSAADRLGRRDRACRRCCRCCCSRSSSCGRRRISGRCRCSSAPIMPRPESRCCRWSPGSQNTRRQIFLYSLPMAAAAVAPWPLGLAGPIYGIARGDPQLRVRRARRARRSPTARPSRRRWRPRSSCSLIRSSICSRCSRVLVADRWLAVVKLEDEVVAPPARAGADHGAGCSAPSSCCCSSSPSPRRGSTGDRDCRRTGTTGRR